jgi:hypothetical protein
MIIDMSIKRGDLYDGCDIENVAGRPNLTTPIAQAADLIGRNIQRIIEGMTGEREVTLTGPAPIWAYLVIFHAVVHRFNAVYYDDGKGNKVLVAAHGAVD